MATPNAVEALLDEAANNVELTKANVARASDGRHEDRNRNGDRYSPHRDFNGRPGRNDRANRNDRTDRNDRVDRNDRHDRDYRNTTRRGRDSIRESDGDRRRSRDRDSRRRDDSQPRSIKGADNTDHNNRNRRPDDGDRYRPGAGGRSGDYYDGRSRVRSRSRSPRRDNNQDSSRGRRGSDEHGRRGRNSGTPPEDDRDKRTIFVQQISQRTRTIHLREFFEQVGPVIEAQIVKDRVTGRTKG